MKERSRRIIAIFFVLNLLIEVVSPTAALALTGGPSQPEVQSFTPVATSDMVNLFSGDFNYNIPLMDIDGYPLNLAYNSGITDDQEASWVGLGWNINPGTVNRGMRGLPDDFKGDVIHKELNMKPNQTFGASFGLGIELFGKDVSKIPGTGFGNLNLTVGLKFNTYSGYGMNLGANLALQQSGENSDGFTGSLGLNSGSEQGLGISADIGYKKSIDGKGTAYHSTTRTNSSLGLNFNTTSGLGSLSFAYSASKTKLNDILNDKGDVIANNLQDANASGGYGYSFASPTYMPLSGPEMVNVGMDISVSFGTALFGSHPKGTIGAFYSGQFLKNNYKDYHAYGYLHSDLANNFHNAANSHNVLHDFNREKDASFTMHTPNLPVTNYSYDSFNYTGQGISGDFRPYRNHVGTVFDPYVTNFPSLNGNLGIELGGGGIAHGGVNVELNVSKTTNGKWTQQNNAEGNALFKSGNLGLNESVYFKQGGEKEAETDMNYFNNVINGFQPVRLGLQVAGAETYLTNDLTTKYGSTVALTNNTRAARARRNESINVLTATQATVSGLETSIKSYTVNDNTVFYGTGVAPTSLPRISSTHQAHHISEITALRDDGARYVYGIPVYNNMNKDVTFALQPSTIDYASGMVSYSPGSDNSTSNSQGLDHYYDSQNMPAYAHAFLLSAVLTPDYVDKTLDGPTRDDLGKYTKFNYSQVATGYRWRSPFPLTSANLNEGLSSSRGASGDDKASYTYGEKEIWYLHSIETKNYVAVFQLESRQDGFGVVDQNGGIDPSQSLRCLKQIDLYSRQSLLDLQGAAVPLKTVHFEYDYSLCPSVYNNSSVGQGKLTLKKVWFSYQSSAKGQLSPYQFSYNTLNSGTNYQYNPKAYDRWGNYKPNNPTGSFQTYTNSGAPTPSLLTSEFPYSEQDSTTASAYAQAWNLSRIQLPSGAQIDVTYEADDYAYVQDKKAMQMFITAGAAKTNSATPVNILYNLTDTNDFVYLNLSSRELSTIASVAASQTISTQKAVQNMFFNDENGQPMTYVYFKYFLNVERNLTLYSPKYEYVNGYAKVNYASPPTLYNNMLVFRVTKVPIMDNITSNATTNPMTMAGINFVRRYMPHVAFDNNQDPFSNGGNNVLALAKGMESAFTPIVQFFKGGMSRALLKSFASQQFLQQKSFIRLYSGTQHKKGGGCRVSKLQLTDNWSAQSNNIASSTSTYGQTYDYVTRDAHGSYISSGVASYEPMIGNEENPFRQPVFYEEKHLLAPDEDYYQETPYGEALFPGPSVGYSRVLVRNLEHKGASFVSRHATGAVVNEFYTARDFPTKTDMTDVKKQRHKPNPVAKFLKFFDRDYMTTSQGYQVVLNDMHGKQKAQWVYKECDPAVLTSTVPTLTQYFGDNYISGVEYNYNRNLDQLTNNVPVIDKTGTISTGQVGVDYDMVMDTRESQTTTRNGKTQGNLEAFLLAIFPGIVPTIFPGYSQEQVRYRSAVITKVLYRYGLLAEVVAHENGASVSTKNTLWDAETGAVRLTQTTNNFSDPVYNVTYPAHWAYDRMGSAAKNLGAQSQIVSGVLSDPSILIVGDEVELDGSSSTRAWVQSVSPAVSIIDNNGIGLSLSGYNLLTVVRSGNRNQQNVSVGQVVSLQSPIIGAGITLNQASSVINAKASEYGDTWSVFCTCGIDPGNTDNPFLTGRQGIFRPISEYVYLTGRSQSRLNDNTNIRQDGPYMSFVPFWSPNPASAPFNWTRTSDPSWQFTTRSTLYSPYGTELENQDALGRSSTAIYGYGHTLPIVVASNALYKQAGFDGFEDYDYNNPCEVDYFNFINYADAGGPGIYNRSSNNYVTKASSENQSFAHTGRRSVKIASGQYKSIHFGGLYVAPPVLTPTLCNSPTFN